MALDLALSSIIHLLFLLLLFFVQTYGHGGRSLLIKQSIFLDFKSPYYSRVPTTMVIVLVLRSSNTSVVD